MSKEKELRDGVVGTAEKLIQSSVEELRTIQSRVDDPVSSEVSSTMPKRVNLQSRITKERKASRTQGAKG